MVNTSKQIGGSIGTSLLSTIYASAVASYLTSHPHVRGIISAAAVHGDTTAFWWATGIFGLGFLLALVILPVRCEARAASVRAALARLAIGNCDYDETEEGAAVTDAPGPQEPALAPKASAGRVRTPVHARQGPGCRSPWPADSYVRTSAVRLFVRDTNRPVRVDATNLAASAPRTFLDAKRCDGNGCLDCTSSLRKPYLRPTHALVGSHPRTAGQ